MSRSTPHERHLVPVRRPAETRRRAFDDPPRRSAEKRHTHDEPLGFGVAPRVHQDVHVAAVRGDRRRVVVSLGRGRQDDDLAVGAELLDDHARVRQIAPHVGDEAAVRRDGRVPRMAVDRQRLQRDRWALRGRRGATTSSPPRRVRPPRRSARARAPMASGCLRANPTASAASELDGGAADAAAERVVLIAGVPGSTTSRFIRLRSPRRSAAD